MDREPKIRKPSDLPLTEIEKEINTLHSAMNALEGKITMNEKTFKAARTAYDALIERRQQIQAFIDTVIDPNSEQARSIALEQFEHVNGKIKEADELFREGSAFNSIDELEDEQMTEALVALEHRRKRNAN